jgi:hypothetical protein
VIDDDRDCRIFGDVSEAFERLIAAFGFFVDSDVEPVFRDGVADGNDVRDTVAIGGSKMRHALPGQEVVLLYIHGSQSGGLPKG